MFLVEERTHAQIIEILLLKSFLKILLIIAHLPTGMHIQVVWHASHASHFSNVVFQVQVIISASATSHYVPTLVCLTRARLVGKLPGRMDTCQWGAFISPCRSAVERMEVHDRNFGKRCWKKRDVFFTTWWLDGFWTMRLHETVARVPFCSKMCKSPHDWSGAKKVPTIHNAPLRTRWLICRNAPAMWACNLSWIELANPIVSIARRKVVVMVQGSCYKGLQLNIGKRTVRGVERD